MFNIVRFFTLKSSQSGFDSLGEFLTYSQVVLGQVLVPVMMVIIFAVSGYYNKPFFRSRLDEIVNTACSTSAGMLIIFFVALIDDDIPERVTNYELMAILWALLFFFTVIERSVITAAAKRMVRKGKITFPTLVIGEGTEALKLAENIEKDPAKGMKVGAFISETATSVAGRPAYSISDVREVCDKHNITHVVISPSYPVSTLMDTLNRLFPCGINILLTPSSFELVRTRGKVSDVKGEPLIELSACPMSELTRNMKRLSDIVLSAVGVVVLSPLMAAVAVAIKLDSEGPVFYTQERVGLNRKIFKIIKFRSMHNEAEKNGPELSREGDSRITRVGRFIRKYRIDELPQLFNILKGEMSLVGPRPERPHYVDMLIRRVPHYSLLCQLRPGLTSWGMVKYGYAHDIDGMIERLKYDLLYLDNVSFPVDMKIIFHTVSTVLSGKGV